MQPPKFLNKNMLLKFFNIRENEQNYLRFHITSPNNLYSVSLQFSHPNNVL